MIEPRHGRATQETIAQHVNHLSQRHKPPLHRRQGWQAKQPAPARFAARSGCSTALPWSFHAILIWHKWCTCDRRCAKASERPFEFGGGNGGVLTWCCVCQHAIALNNVKAPDFISKSPWCLSWCSQNGCCMAHAGWKHQQHWHWNQHGRVKSWLTVVCLTIAAWSRPAARANFTAKASPAYIANCWNKYNVHLSHIK